MGLDGSRHGGVNEFSPEAALQVMKVQEGITRALSGQIDVLTRRSRLPQIEPHFHQGNPPQRIQDLPGLQAGGHGVGVAFAAFQPALPGRARLSTVIFPTLRPTCCTSYTLSADMGSLEEGGW